MESLNIDILESIQKEIGLLRTMIYDSFYGFGIGIYSAVSNKRAWWNNRVGLPIFEIKIIM